MKVPWLALSVLAFFGGRMVLRANSYLICRHQSSAMPFLASQALLNQAEMKLCTWSAMRLLHTPVHKGVQTVRFLFGRPGCGGVGVSSTYWTHTRTPERETAKSCPFESRRS